VANYAAIAIENARLFRSAQLELEERTRVEEQLRLSIDEKEVLLREIHHRVKNNLQIISSLLNLQAGRIDDGRLYNAFLSSQDRIQSMSLVHEQLYQSEDLAKVDFAVYVENLVAHLLRSQESEPGQIDLVVNADQVFLNIDTAIPCGLIVGELVSNSLKHAFPEGRRGRIDVSLKPKEDDHWLLSVSDDGVGMDQDNDLQITDTLGLQLVNALVRQLSAEIELDRTRGTEYRISFAVEEMHQEKE
jgi:two-component sensor histidine kinase